MMVIAVRKGALTARSTFRDACSSANPPRPPFLQILSFVSNLVFPFLPKPIASRHM